MRFNQLIMLTAKLSFLNFMSREAGLGHIYRERFHMYRVSLPQQNLGIERERETTFVPSMHQIRP